MITVTPQTGADSSWQGTSDPCPAHAGRIDFPGHIFGSSVLFGRLGLSPAGVALRLDERAERDDFFEIALVAETGDTLLSLGRFDDADVVAVWRELGDDTGLPLLTQSEDGALQHPYPQVGRVQLGRVRIRRRRGMGRRPRFLVRRKTTRLPRRPLVHREREITGEGRV